MGLPKIQHTQVSNEFIDNWMRELNPAAVKVFLAISRKTIGWHKEVDAISLSQIQELTGIGRQGVSNSLKELEGHGLISGQRKGGKSTQWTINYEELVHSVDQTSPLSGPPLVHSVDSQKILKETLQKKDGVEPAAPQAEAAELTKNIMSFCETQHGKRFTAYAKEGAAAKRLGKIAQRERPEDPRGWLKQIFEAFDLRKNQGRGWWKDRPWAPSAIAHSAVIDVLMEDLKASDESDEWMNEFLQEGIKDEARRISAMGE